MMHPGEWTLWTALAMALVLSGAVTIRYHLLAMKGRGPFGKPLSDRHGVRWD